MKKPIKYKVYLHRSGEYRYACTQPSYIDPETKKRKYRRIHWGTVDEDNRFFPNQTFLDAPEEERECLLFPEEWDLSEVRKVERGEGRLVPLHERRLRTLRAKKERMEEAEEETIPSGRMILKLIDRLEKEKIPSEKILEIVKSMGEE